MHSVAFGEELPEDLGPMQKTNDFPTNLSWERWSFVTTERAHATDISLGEVTLQIDTVRSKVSTSLCRSTHRLTIILWFYDFVQSTNVPSPVNHARINPGLAVLHILMPIPAAVQPEE